MQVRCSLVITAWGYDTCLDSVRVLAQERRRSLLCNADKTSWERNPHAYLNGVVSMCDGIVLCDRRSAIIPPTYYLQGCRIFNSVSHGLWVFVIKSVGKRRGGGLYIFSLSSPRSPAALSRFFFLLHAFAVHHFAENHSSTTITSRMGMPPQPVSNGLIYATYAVFLYAFFSFPSSSLWS